MRRGAVVCGFGDAGTVQSNSPGGAAVRDELARGKKDKTFRRNPRPRFRKQK